MRIVQNLCDMCGEIILHYHCIEINAGMGAEHAETCSSACSTRFAKRIIEDSGPSEIIRLIGGLRKDREEDRKSFD